MYIFGYKTTVFIQNLYILVKFFGKNFVFRVKSTIFWFFRTKYTFLGTKLQFLSKICILVFWQKLHFYCKFFGKCTFWCKKYKIFVFSGPNVHFWVQNYSFYPKFIFFLKFFGKNFIFSVKITILFVFRDQMYIFG